MITVIFDTETTGLIKPQATQMKEQPYITEIFCLKVSHSRNGDFEIMDEFESLCKVPVPLSPEITRITGLQDSDLANAPTFGEIQPKLSKFFTGVHNVVAHNLAFDRSMLANELVRCGKVLNFPWPANHICTVERTMHIEQRRMSLTRLHEHLFNQSFTDAHRAKNDVMPLYRCFKHLVETKELVI
jgi:DNA polymerase III epsilon subunit-like protein